MSTTLELIKAISEGDAVSIEGAFSTSMAEKISAQLDDMRVQIAQNMFNVVTPEEVEFTAEEWDTLSEEEKAQYHLIDEASKASDAGLQNRMNKGFTKSVATRYDGTRKQEAEGKKALVKTAKVIKSRGGDSTAAKQTASNKNSAENEM
jgi:hypothetical protein